MVLVVRFWSTTLPKVSQGRDLVADHICQPEVGAEVDELEEGAGQKMVRGSVLRFRSRSREADHQDQIRRQENE